MGNVVEGDYLKISFGGRRMAKITVGTENQTPIELYYEDHSTGKPVVLFTVGH